MRHSDESRARAVSATSRRQQTPAWVGIDHAFEGDDDRQLMELQAREFPLAMHVLFDWARDAYRQAERTTGVDTVLGDLASAERNPDPRCLREFYAYVAGVYRRSLPGSTQGELAFDGTPHDVRLQEGWRKWLSGLFRGMLNQPELINDVLVAQIHATAPIGRKAGARVVHAVWERFQQVERGN
jgi:hypothetical protein